MKKTLTDRSDGATTICEIKYNDQTFLIDKDYAQKLLNKVKVYEQQTKTKKLFLTMITVNGLKSSMYSEEIIDGVVHLDNLFVEFT